MANGSESLESTVKDLIRERCLNVSLDPNLLAFNRYFQEQFGESLLAVIFYGSCLSEVTRRPTSIYDFFLVCDDYRSFHRSRVHAYLNFWLPPNVYYLEFFDPRQGWLRAKYGVISLGHLQRETSRRARDIYHAGRLAKRVAVVYIKNQEIQEQLVEALYRAMEKNVSLSLALMPSVFRLDDFILALLSLSYRGETRVDVDTKVEEIFCAERDFYRRCYHCLLRKHFRDKRLGSAINSYYFYPRSRLAQVVERVKLRRVLSWNRFRAYLRWPKYMITFSNWVDYLLNKVERSKGIRILLTERERRYPLIFGWKHFFKLKREGKIK